MSRVPFRTCVYRGGKGRNAPAEDKQSSRIFGRDLTTLVFVWEGRRGGVEDEEMGKVQEQSTRARNQHAHPRAMCARRRDGLPRPFWIDKSSHASSSSASSALVPTQIACPGTTTR